MEGKKPEGRANVIAGVLALILTLALIGVLSLESARYESDAAHRSADHSRNAQREITRHCFVVPPAQYTQCVTQGEDANRQYEREEQNLAAQKTAAWWTWITGAAAVAGVALSGFGVFLVYGTFRENKRSADAAYAALEHDRQQLRPHVYIGDAKVDLPLTKESIVRIEIKNHGSLPATDLLVGVTTEFATCPIGDQWRNMPIHPDAWEKAGALGPQGETVAVLPLEEVRSEQLLAILKGEGALVMQISVQYEGPNLRDSNQQTLTLDLHSAKTGEMLMLTEWGRKNAPTPGGGGELAV